MSAIPELGARNPCRMPLDFDGDRTPDSAHLLRASGGASKLVVGAQGKRGVVVAFSSGTFAQAGAGRAVGNGGDDFAWMDAWSVVPRSALPRWAKGDGLLVEKTEGAGGLIAWDGKRVRWQQHGD